MRKFLAFFLLAGVAILLWSAARLTRRGGDLRMTVVLASAEGLHGGSEVVSGGRTIGTVLSVALLDRDEALSLCIDREHRLEMLSDSLFSIGRQGTDPVLVVTNALAVGKPLEDGAVVRVKTDRISQWLTRHEKQLDPILGTLQRRANRAIEEYQTESLDQTLEKLKARLPEWKKEGGAALERNVAEARQQVERLEAKLRKQDRASEADVLRRKFEEWASKARDSVRR